MARFDEMLVGMPRHKEPKNVWSRVKSVDAADCVTSLLFQLRLMNYKVTGVVMQALILKFTALSADRAPSQQLPRTRRRKR